jgi:hypothetical protein
VVYYSKEKGVDMELSHALFAGSDQKLVLIFRFDPITGKIKKVQRLKEAPGGIPLYRIRRREYHTLLRKHFPRNVMTLDQRRESHRKSVAEYRKRKKETNAID